MGKVTLTTADGREVTLTDDSATINTDSTQNADGEYGVVEEAPELKADIEIKVPNPSPQPQKQSLPLPNVLGNYNTSNYIITLACLTNEEVALPDKTYRRNGFSKTILRSGGGAQNKARTAYEKSGELEYFVDNLNIDEIITPTDKTRTSNATIITFDVAEPYSMGLFLQSLQIAATKEGENINYLDAAYCLKIEFVGYDDVTLEPRKVTNGVRYFPLKFTKVDFSVNAAGSSYSVQAIPWNEQAQSDVVQSIKTDVDLTGTNLVEILQTGPKSLASVMNSRLLEQEKTGQSSKADEIIIIFPPSKHTEIVNSNVSFDDNSAATTKNSKSSSATRMNDNTDRKKLWESLGQNPNEEVPDDFDAYLSTILGYVVRRGALSESIKASQIDGNINSIGKSKLVADTFTTGHQPYGFAKYQYDAENKSWKSGGTTISADYRNFIFERGTKIEKIIEELILISDYGKTLTQALLSNTEGDVDWFRIDTQVYPIANRAQSATGGRSPKLFVYRILPYKVHSSNLLAPTKPGIGYEALKKQAVKSYNYIYTGKNQDILEFDITLNNAFFAGISADGDSLSAETVQGAKTKSKPVDEPGFASNQGGSQTTVREQNKRNEFVNNTATGNRGGLGNDTTETRVARTFHEAIVNSQVDLLTLNMRILGDPYYIADSGMGNYNSKPTTYLNLNENGSINYQDREVDVVVNFRTPIDWRPDGLMEFPEDTIPVKPFSGLYRVLKVQNIFESGRFEQELQLIRRPNQDESVDEATSAGILNRLQATPEQKKAQAEILARVPDAKTVQQESGSF